VHAGEPLGQARGKVAAAVGLSKTATEAASEEVWRPGFGIVWTASKRLLPLTIIFPDASLKFPPERWIRGKPDKGSLFRFFTVETNRPASIGRVPCEALA
jgi:hypothetical protein